MCLMQALLFQSPKGRLQTTSLLNMLLQSILSFNPQRGGYKPIPPILNNWVKKVSIPKGEATNDSTCSNWKRQRSVSIPKGEATNMDDIDTTKKIKFQSPKGRLQTVPGVDVGHIINMFQSPKGRLQTRSRAWFYYIKIIHPCQCFYIKTFVKNSNQPRRIKG